MKIFIIFLAACILAGCSPDISSDGPVRVDPSALNGERAFEEVRQLLDIPNRVSGTPRAKEAAEHIRQRLQELGINAEIDSFKDATPQDEKQFHNVIARIPGAGEGVVLIGSHFDMKAGMPPGFQGANDSGSSTGLLIELGRVLSQCEELPYDVELLFFDGEECLEHYSSGDGLHGSRHHAEKLVESGRANNYKAAIILDMVGDKDLDIAFPRNTSRRLVKTAFAAARKAGLRKYFSLGEHSVIDDHVPFREAGIPVINFIDFNYGSRPGLNDYWHTAEDTIGKLSPESLAIVGEVVLETVNRI